MDEHTIPFDGAAEDAVIASVLVDSDTLRDCNLAPDDFHVRQNQEAWRAITELAKRGTGINQVTVVHELQRTGKLKDVTAAHLSSIVATLPTSLYCAHYAGIVRQCATRRKLIEIAGKLPSLAVGAETADAALAEADAMITALRRNRSTLEVISPRDRAEMMLEEYTQRNERLETIAVPTHLPRLDNLLGGGVYPGELMVIGARPSMGKTTLAQYIANRVQTPESAVLFCSAEMTISGLTDRDVAEMVGVHLSAIRGGRYQPDMFQRIINAVGKLDERNIYYLPRGNMTVARIAQAADATANRAGSLKLIVVDHLGRLRPSYRGQPRHIELGEMTSELADLAKEMHCALILLCQLNRELEHRDDKRPSLEALRESGRIEEDADIVLLLYRHRYYYPNDPDTSTEITVAKLRQSDDGRKRGVKVVYDRATGFQEIG